MKRSTYLILLVLLALTACLASAFAQAPATTTVVLTSAERDYTELFIGLLSPVLIWLMTKITPKIPKPFLPIITPLIGILLGYLISLMTRMNLSWFDAAKAGALAVFFREVINQWITKRMLESEPPEVPKPEEPKL